MPLFDAHIHVQPWDMIKPEVLRFFADQIPYRDEAAAVMKDPGRLLSLMDSEGVGKAVLVNYVAPEVMGFNPGINEFVAKYASACPERLVPVGSVNPRHTKDAGAETVRLIGMFGIRTFKIHPPHQLFAPNDYLGPLPALRQFYEVAQENGAIVIIHTGTTTFPGARIKYGHPLAIDDVAVDFPDLKIVMAHGGRPLWCREAFYLLRRHRNVFMDISSIPPKRLLDADYFPRLGEVAERVLYGSDWPGMGVGSLGSNGRLIEGLPLTREAKEAILWGNAERVFRRNFEA